MVHGANLALAHEISNVRYLIGWVHWVVQDSPLPGPKTGKHDSVKEHKLSPNIWETTSLPGKLAGA